MKLSNVFGNSISMALMSLLKRLRILPAGVMSKMYMGQRKRDVSKLEWILTAAFVAPIHRLRIRVASENAANRYIARLILLGNYVERRMNYVRPTKKFNVQQFLQIIPFLMEQTRLVNSSILCQHFIG